jgi:hypothetical protein
MVARRARRACRMRIKLAIKMASNDTHVPSNEKGNGSKRREDHTEITLKRTQLPKIQRWMLTNRRLPTKFGGGGYYMGPGIGYYGGGGISIILLIVILYLLLGSRSSVKLAMSIRNA